MLRYRNQASHVLIVDCPSLRESSHQQGLCHAVPCLRDTLTLATMTGPPSLLPGLAILLVWPDKVEQLLTLMTPHSSSMKVVYTALSRLDTILSSLVSCLPVPTMDTIPTLTTAITQCKAMLTNTTAEIQPHILTCRSKEKIQDIMHQLGDITSYPGLRPYKILCPNQQQVQSSLLGLASQFSWKKLNLKLEPEEVTIEINSDSEEEVYWHQLAEPSKIFSSKYVKSEPLESQVSVTRFIDKLDLDSYFRSWILHQSSDSPDLKVELESRGMLEVLLLDLRSRSIDVSNQGQTDKGVERLSSVCLVSMSGVCQSLTLGQGHLVLATQAKLLSERELRENRDTVSSLHRELVKTANCLLLRCQTKMYSLSPCSEPFFLLQRLSTAETLLPLDVSARSGHNYNRKIVSILKELEHKELYNPLEHNLGGLELTRERSVKTPTDTGYRGRGRGNSRGSGTPRTSRRGFSIPHCL